jgi:hypothetical protein
VSKTKTQKDKSTTSSDHWQITIKTRTTQISAPNRKPTKIWTHRPKFNYLITQIQNINPQTKIPTVHVKIKRKFRSRILGELTCQTTINEKIKRDCNSVYMQNGSRREGQNTSTKDFHCSLFLFIYLFIFTLCNFPSHFLETQTEICSKQSVKNRSYKNEFEAKI